MENTQQSEQVKLGQSVSLIENIQKQDAPTDPSLKIYFDRKYSRLSKSLKNQPGIYMIHCIANDYRYYGETSNLNTRIASHKKGLRSNSYINVNLQNDYNLFGESCFEFIILFMGPDWVDKQARMETESQLISNHPGLCYNLFARFSDRKGLLAANYGLRHSEKTKAALREVKKGMPLDQLGKVISISGKTYPSIAEASRQTGRARKYIRDHLNCSEFPDWFYISEKPNDYPKGE